MSSLWVGLKAVRVLISAEATTVALKRLVYITLDATFLSWIDNLLTHYGRHVYETAGFHFHLHRPRLSPRHS
jgi:hypothetical protein